MSDRPVLDAKEVKSRDVEITAEMVEAGVLVLDQSGYLDRAPIPADSLLIERVLKACLSHRLAE